MKKGGLPLLAIVEFPTVVQDAVERFGSVFANEPERRHFAEYFTGLMVADKKNTSGKHYALEFRRFRKRDACEAKRKELEELPGGFDKAPVPRDPGA